MPCETVTIPGSDDGGNGDGDGGGTQDPCSVLNGATVGIGVEPENNCHPTGSNNIVDIVSLSSNVSEPVTSGRITVDTIVRNNVSYPVNVTEPIIVNGTEVDTYTEDFGAMERVEKGFDITVPQGSSTMEVEIAGESTGPIEIQSGTGPGQGNLEVTTVLVTADNLSPGNSATVELTVENTGSSQASSTFSASVNGEQVKEIEVGPVGAGRMVFPTFTVEIPNTEEMEVAVGGESTTRFIGSGSEPPPDEEPPDDGPPSDGPDGGGGQGGEADLVAESVNIQGEPLEPFTQADVQFTIVNEGSDTGTRVFPVSVNGQEILELDVGPMPSGQTIQSTIDFEVPDTTQVTVQIGSTSDVVQTTGGSQPPEEEPPGEEPPGGQPPPEEEPPEEQPPGGQPPPEEEPPEEQPPGGQPPLGGLLPGDGSLDLSNRDIVILSGAIGGALLLSRGGDE